MLPSNFLMAGNSNSFTSVKSLNPQLTDAGLVVKLNLSMQGMNAG